MEDEDIAPNTYGTADPVGMSRKSCLCTILEYTVLALARLSAHIGTASSSSSILRVYLYITYSSMVRTATVYGIHLL